MQLLLEVKNQSEYQLLLQYVNLLKSARMLQSTPVLKSAKKAKKSFFDRHYGSLKTKMSTELIENQLKSLRDEWERPTW